MATKPSDLLADSLFQVNLVLWMLQPPNGSNIRPFLAEAGYKLRSIEPPLPLGPTLVAKLKARSIEAKENASPDVIVATDEADHLLVECKASMFGAISSENGSDGSQRQARSFLLQTPSVLRSALGGPQVSEVNVAYLTRNSAEHDQAEGLLALAKELRSAKLPTADCCVWRLVEHEGGIGLVAPMKADKWPKRVRTACKIKRGSKAITLIPRDEDGNDLRPLYLIPWMPDSEAQPCEYNRRAFGNRILGEAVARIGRTPVGADVLLDFNELLETATLGVFRRWRNKAAKHALHKCVRRLIWDHLGKTGVIKIDPDGTNQSALVKLSDEKIKAAVIKAFRETIQTEWDRPDPQGDLFDMPPADEGPRQN